MLLVRLVRLIHKAANFRTVARMSLSDEMEKGG